MDVGGGRERKVSAARALLELAREYADRAQATEAALLAEFGSRAAALAPEIGPLVVESDEDEQLLLRADGILAGEVLDDETGSWTAVDSPEEVARYYDPTDVFLDLADALVERFPELARAEELGDGGRAADADELGDGGRAADADELGDAGRPDDEWATPGSPGPAEAQDGRPATAGMLEDLRRSGVLSDEEYERLRAQLEG